MTTRQSGFGLVQALVSIALLTIIVLGFSRLARTIFLSSRASAVMTEEELLKNTIRNYIDCDATFENYGNADLNNLSSCPNQIAGQSTDVSKSFEIYRSVPGLINAPLRIGGERDPATGEFRVGQYNLKATCDAEAQTLLITARHTVAGGATARNQLAGTDYETRVLFGTANPLCYSGGKTGEQLCSQIGGSWDSATNKCSTDCGSSTGTTGDPCTCPAGQLRQANSDAPPPYFCVDDPAACPPPNYVQYGFDPNGYCFKNPDTNMINTIKCLLCDPTQIN